MNHPLKAKLLIYMDENPDDLSAEQLADYIWLVEQQLYELRQRQILDRVQAAQENPVRP